MTKSVAMGCLIISCNAQKPKDDDFQKINMTVSSYDLSTRSTNKCNCRPIYSSEYNATAESLGNYQGKQCAVAQQCIVYHQYGTYELSFVGYAIDMR